MCDASTDDQLQLEEHIAQAAQRGEQHPDPAVCGNDRGADPQGADDMTAVPRSAIGQRAIIDPALLVDCAATVTFEQCRRAQFGWGWRDQILNADLTLDQ